MRTGYTGHIAPSEWRWVTVISSALVLVALLPFLWVVLSGNSEQQFMGALHNYPATTSHLAKIVQGVQGDWLGRYIHTPEPHNGVLIDGIYILLGQLSRFTSIPTIIIFHVARVGASIFMYTAIYYLAATIWMRVRTRRIFFLIAVFGSGFGWLFAPLMQDPNYPDLTHALLFPFYTTLVNVHLPLAMGCAAILVSAIIEAMRPGYDLTPSVNNAGGALFTFSLLFTFLYPQGLLPIAIAFVGLLLARSIHKRKLSSATILWLMWFCIPALPLTAYYASVFLYNPVVAQVWLRENQPLVPSVLVLVLGLGLPLLIALPGIYRAIRKFEPDGNQFMLLWLLAMLLLSYLTPLIRIHFALGLMLPIAYFGARAAEDFWFTRISRNWRYRLVVALIPILSISHLYVLFLPVTPIMNNPRTTSSGILLELDYARAFRWLAALRTTPHDVVLASPEVSLWLPAWTGMRVVYGYASETLDADVKRRAVENWYNTANESECMRLLNGRYSAYGGYRVHYVIYGPRERKFGTTACLGLLTPIVRFGSVTIYSYPLPISSD